MHEICIKIEFGSQRREHLLFLYTNMAAVTSRENDLLLLLLLLLLSNLKKAKYNNDT